jgi:transcription antitermination factor NusG
VIWAVASTHPNIEARVASKLEAAGFALQMFWVRTTTVLHGALVNHFRPAFPRYLFVQAEERWRELREISGVTGFLTDSEGYPARVSGLVVEDLMRRSTVMFGKTVLVVPPRQSKFKFGDNVQVIGNSLISGRKGIFQQLSGDVHATLLIEVMGRFIPFRVPESDLVLSPARTPKKPHHKNWRDRKPRRVGAATAPTLIMSTA